MVEPKSEHNLLQINLAFKWRDFMEYYYYFDINNIASTTPKQLFINDAV